MEEVESEVKSWDSVAGGGAGGSLKTERDGAGLDGVIDAAAAARLGRVKVPSGVDLVESVGGEGAGMEATDKGEGAAGEAALEATSPSPTDGSAEAELRDPLRDPRGVYVVFLGSGGFLSSSIGVYWLCLFGLFPGGGVGRVTAGGVGCLSELVEGEPTVEGGGEAAGSVDIDLRLT